MLGAFRLEYFLTKSSQFVSFPDLRFLDEGPFFEDFCDERPYGPFRHYVMGFECPSVLKNHLEYSIINRKLVECWTYLLGRILADE